VPFNHRVTVDGSTPQYTAKAPLRLPELLIADFSRHVLVAATEGMADFLCRQPVYDVQ
jgi:hypothetical protein